MNLTSSSSTQHNQPSSAEPSSSYSPPSLSSPDAVGNGGNGNSGGDCNGHGNGVGPQIHFIEPMEMEELHPRPSVRQQLIEENAGSNYTSNYYRPRDSTFDQLWHLLKLFMELNPITTTVIGFVFIGFLLHGVINVMFSSNGPGGGGDITSKQEHYDYSHIDFDYNFRASKVDRWCLFGDDDSCPCEGFIAPVSREERRGWKQTQQHNVERIDDYLSKKNKYDIDVAFLGDETTEIWNGRWLNIPINNKQIDGFEISKYWNDTFTPVCSNNPQFNGLALGIAGDSTSNLLWRIKEGGEVPATLKPKVWWVLIGGNDLAHGGCSEEASTLGILRIAEEIHHIDPEAVIVLQGILPRSSEVLNGRVDADAASSSPPLHGASMASSVRTRSYDNKPRTPEMARSHAVLWPSIQRINKQLDQFCANHDHLVYFDASKLFLGNALQQRIIRSRMPDYIHPSTEGMKVMGDAIVKELDRIINQHDEHNSN